MVARYAPRIKCRPGRGAVTLFEDQVVVSAPIDYGYANWFQDPTTKAGYVHAFLPPFRAVVAGWFRPASVYGSSIALTRPLRNVGCPAEGWGFIKSPRGLTCGFF